MESCSVIGTSSIVLTISFYFSFETPNMYSVGLRLLPLENNHFKKIFVNWRVIALHHWVGFCHMSVWISFLLNLPSTPHPIRPLGYHRAPDLGTLHHTVDFHYLSNFTYGNVYVSMLLLWFILPSPSPSVFTSLFSMSVSPLLLCK